MTAPRKVLRKLVSIHADKLIDSQRRSLHLAMIGCEDTSTYGPELHTASMCLTLLCRAIESKFNCSAVKNSSVLQESEDDATRETSNNDSRYWEVKISIYNGKQRDFPTTLDLDDVYDGIILPGSLSSAYDGCKEPWIAALQHYIQTEIHANKRKTLGICFGHQIMAHSFTTDNGLATKCSHGSQVGLYPYIQLTPSGKSLCLRQSLLKHLLVTHSDMVQSLPSCATPLAGTTQVPIIAAAYFSNQEQQQKPYAITFQAHPEYGTSQETFINVIEKMHQRELIDSGTSRRAKEEAQLHSKCIEYSSIEVMISTGTALQWL